MSDEEFDCVNFILTDGGAPFYYNKWHHHHFQCLQFYILQPARGELKKKKKMPRLLQPLTMRKCALQSVAEHLEIICYGCVGRGAEMRRMIQDDSYLVSKQQQQQQRQTGWRLLLLWEIIIISKSKLIVPRLIITNFFYFCVTSFHIGFSVCSAGWWARVHLADLDLKKKDSPRPTVSFVYV